MRALLVLALVGALIVGVPLYLEHAQRPALEALAHAASDGRADEVRALLAAGIDPNEEVEGMRPLEHAARCGHLDVVALLLAHGAVIPGKSRSEMDAASRVLAGEHDAVLRLLLLASSFPPVSPPGPWRLLTPPFGSILFLVAADGDAELARALVEAGSPLDEARTMDGMSPLCGAAISGSVPIAKLLLARGADATVRTHIGRTPLHHAALGGAPEIVEDLLAAGADPSVADQLGWTPLHLAALCGHGSAVQALAAPTAGANCLDARDVFGWTPLMRAVASGDARSVDELLVSGADVQVATASGRSALHVASERGFDALYERLVAAGANEDARDSFDTSPRELRATEEIPFGDLEARRFGQPIVSAGWFNHDSGGGEGMEFVAWEDGVVAFSELLPSFPWTKSETMQIGRIPAARARRLSVELKESSLFLHPIYAGVKKYHGTERNVGRRAEQAGENKEWFGMPFGQDFASIDWRFEPETNATVQRLWRDVRAILASARPTLTEPLTDHFVDRHGIGEGTFRSLSWSNE